MILPASGNSGSLFRIDGAVSGLDTTSIVNGLMSIERRPLERLQEQESTVTSRQNVLQSIRRKLSALQSATSALTLQATVNAKNVSTNTPSTSPATISASAGPEAANGTFDVSVTRLATATKLSSNDFLGQGIGTTVALASAGFAVTPATGYFTITTANGGAVTSAQISIDSSTTLSDGAGDLPGANSILAKINAAGLGLTASIENDSAGRPNLLRITTAPGVQMILGAGGDTSNFLTVAKLADAVQSGTAITSTANLGTVTPTAALSGARFRTALAGLDGSGSGSFKINGVQINFSQSESLNAVLTRINGANAGVVASYDPVQDSVKLTATKTGSTTISLENVTGNLLTSLGLVDAGGALIGTQAVGQNAQYSVSTVNGGAGMTSASNTITGVIPGVTLNLLGETASAVTVTISQNTTSTVTAVDSFVGAFNAALRAVRDATRYDATTKSSGPMVGDSSLMAIDRQLRSLASSVAVGASGRYRTLGDVGISFGAVGSDVGTTNELTVDRTKLTSALADSPQAAAQLLAGFQSTATLSGAGQIASFTGTPTGHQSGSYSITSSGLDASDNLSVVFTPAAGIARSAVSETLLSGATNTTAVPGLILQGAGAPAAGTQTVAVTVQQLGVFHSLNDYLVNLTSTTDGVFAARQEADEAEVRRLDSRIREVQDRLTEREKALYARFTALESALAQLKTQGNQVAASIAGLPTGR